MLGSRVVWAFGVRRALWTATTLMFSNQVKSRLRCSTADVSGMRTAAMDEGNTKLRDGKKLTIKHQGLTW